MLNYQGSNLVITVKLPRKLRLIARNPVSRLRTRKISVLFGFEFQFGDILEFWFRVLHPNHLSSLEINRLTTI